MTPREAVDAIHSPLPLSVHNRGLIANLINELETEVDSLRRDKAAYRAGQGKYEGKEL